MEDPMSSTWWHWARVTNEVRDEVFRLATEKGWHDGPKASFGERLALIHSELSEALECWREGLDPTTEIIDTEKDGKPEGIPSELADVIIRVLALCGEYDIDIGRNVMMKHFYNRKRPYRHGGKRC